MDKHQGKHTQNVEECTKGHTLRYTYKEAPNYMLKQLIFRRAPRKLHMEPTRNALNEDELERPQKGCGRTPGSADPPHWAQLGPTFTLSPPLLPYPYSEWG